MNKYKALDLRPIHIEWNMQSPGLTPKGWRIFDSAEVPANAAREPLEAALNLPHGSINVLDFAFEQRLSRTQGWDLSKLAHPEAHEAAARIFRRGVVTTRSKVENLKGAYEVRFSLAEDPLSDLGDQGLRVIDSEVQRLWNIPTRPGDVVIHLTEITKSLDSIAELLSKIAPAEGPITILGGGILADTAAFAAALAGKDFRLLPTTLLAMVDACVGGKTGVNFEGHGKNQLGLFAFPTEVIINANWLKTLSEREIKAGLAESYKHAIITGDESFAAEIAQLEPTAESITPYVHRLIEVKAKIITEDPNEAGKRAILNFGHTLAHALEKISQEENPKLPLLHGEAIAIGMRFAAFLSFRTQHLRRGPYERIQEQLRHAKFMISNSDFENHLGSKTKILERLMTSIKQDKKNASASASSEWVLLKDFGVFVQTGSLYTVAVADSEIKKSWETFVSQEGFSL